ncbi:hypothetical protein ACGK9U_06635 [Mariniflexile sp. HNIBRBA6329]|uniref:hypothetical protein n=1 Tax=Mariniflexile sp. HNIBRBA6329 TaxID=3373088 RepID=UPI003745DBCD
MKKIILLLCLTLFLGCSSSDDSSSSKNNSSSINPPDWIQGTWLFDSSIDSGYQFTSDDFCIISLCTKSCKNEEMESFSGIEGQTNTVEEEITDSSYSVTIFYSNETKMSGTRNTYVFEKVSDSEIKISGRSTIYNKQDNDWEICALFEENSIYPLNNDDAWLVISVGNAPTLAEVTLEIYREDGSIEKNVSDPNSYLSKAIRINKDATKAKLTVRDRDNLSGVKFSVSSKLYNSDYSKQYFVLYEEDKRGLSKTILFK